MNGRGRTFFQSLPALRLFFRGVRLLEDVGPEVFTNPEIVRCGFDTALVISAGIAVDVILAGRIH